MNMPNTRLSVWASRIPTVPSYRWKQFEQALFDASIRNVNGITTFPKALRDTLSDTIPWMTVQEIQTLHSASTNTDKAVLELRDHCRIETVLMENRRGQWTVCISSQVGCAMRCQFCATGSMGFMRNLTADEIIDQYRYWQQFLANHPQLPLRISNIVFMGMGEPLANYENVCAAIRTLLEYTDIGHTHITVSTVGMLPQLEKLLDDPLWPHVRIAVSLHSANPVTRKTIVPTSHDDFLQKLADWSRRYLKKFGNRRHHLTFEYVLLAGVNDDAAHANKLAKFVNSLGKIKVNLIPYNTTGARFKRTSQDAADQFLAILHGKGVIATIRKTMGDDIAAACGQLITEVNQASQATAACGVPPMAVINPVNPAGQ